nr:uncharacterized protein LOC108120655 [Drosophila bipectinata]
MPLKFNDALEVLLQKLPKMSDNINPEHIEYADQICNQIYQALKDINSIFKGTITGLNRTCYINSLCPEYLSIGIDINMPFTVDLEENGIIRSDSSALLEYKLKTSKNYPAVQNGYVSPQRLKILLDLDLNMAIEKIQKFKGSKGEIFKLHYASKIDENTSILVCQIGAIEESNDKKDKPLESAIILFYFLPKFKFSNLSKMYLMLHSESGFILVKEGQDKLITKNMVDLEKLLFYLKVGKIESPLSHNFIVLLKRYGDMATILLQALRELILSSKDTGRQKKLKFIYAKLLLFKKSDSVEMQELMELFGQK